MSEQTVVPSTAEREEDLAWWATWLGVLSCAVILIDGLVLMFQRHMISCPDGTYFGPNSDGNCYAHPHLGLGLAAAAASFGLGSLVMLGNIAARAALGRGVSRP